MGAGLGNPGASGGMAAVDIDTSSELRAILTDETGTGAAVFATSPTLVTPNLGTPSALVLTNATGLPATAIADPNRLYQTTVAISKANIISAGFASNSGLALVSGEASKILIFERAYLRYDYSTATYGAGGNTSVRYSVGGASYILSNALGNTSHFGAANDTSSVIIPAALTDLTTTDKDIFIGASLVLVTTAQFTDPGTAAGTASIDVFYRIVTPG